MIDQKTISIRRLSFAALAVALITLPFSIVLCHIALTVFLLLWIFEGKWNEKYLIIKGSVALQILLAFTISQLAGLLYTDQGREGFPIIEKKIFLFTMPFALATCRLKFDSKEIKLLMYFFTAACIAGTLVCIGHALWQTTLYLSGQTSSGNITYLNASHFKDFNPSTTYSPWLFFSYVGLADGISIHPSYFSLYLIFCIVFLLHELISGENRAKHRALLMLLVSILSVAIMLLSSKIMILCLFVIYLSLMGYWLYHKNFRVGFGYVATLLILISIILYANPVSRYRNLQEYTKTGLAVKEHTVYKTSAEIRASLWWLSWKTFTQNNAWFGAGTGDVKSSMKKTSDKYEITNILESQDPHNQFLYTLIGNGIIGLALLILWFTYPIICAFVRQDYFYLAFAFIFLALCATESALELQKGIVFFAIMHPLLGFQRQSFQHEIITLNFSGARN